MQVTCPNCRARYAVDPLAIGPSGRTVQCARCNERWFETVKVEATPPPSPPAPPPSEKREPAAGGAKPAGTGVLSWLPFKSKARPQQRKPEAPRQDKQEPSAEPSKPAARIDTAPISGPIPDVVIRPPTRGAMLPALIEPKANRRMNLVLLGALAVLVLMAAGIFAFHNVIADQLPPEWRSILRFSA